MKYELTFLLNEEAQVTEIKKIIESLKAAIIKEDSWGKKLLSYPIKKATSAFFYSWVIDLEQTKAKELSKKLNFSEKVLRYILLISE